MQTTPLTLMSGKVINLALPDLYQLVAADPADRMVLDIPNEALIAVVDLLMYGATITAPESDRDRLKESRRYLLAQWALARLCCYDPPLILVGDVPPGALTPRDIQPADLAAIVAFFQTGGSISAPTTTDNELESGAPADPTSETLEPPTE